MKEASFQRHIVTTLRGMGCVVFKMQQNATTQKGTPDLLFLYGPKYGFIECKQSSTAKFRPFQKEKVAMFDKMSFARVAYPENWDTVLKEIKEFLDQK